MKTALIVIAEGCEELEAVTIIDLLRRARIQVTVAGLTSEVVTASRGVRLVPDVALADVSEHGQVAFDVVVLPGGLGGVQRLSASEAVRELLTTQLEAGRLVGAICAAPAALRTFGLLEGKRVTSYPGSIPETDEAYTYVR